VLWKGQNWARILTIVLSVVIFVSAIINLVNGDVWSLIDIIVFGLIGSYLWFSSL